MINFIVTLILNLIMKIRYWLLAMVLVLPIMTWAQEDEEEEDFSMYDDYGSDESIKRFCTPKISGLSPAKLITVGFDFAGPHTIDADSIGAGIPSERGEVSNYMGVTLGANLPVLSNNKILINVGANYTESRFSYKNDSLVNPLHQTLDEGIKTFGVNTTIFKPLNEKHFLLGFFSAEYSGNYTFKNMQPLSFLRGTGVAVFGWKPHARLQYGFGATQSYRAGEVNYFPIIMYNYTSKNEKWGIEALLPARGHYRYSFNRQTMLLAGFELVGTSYLLSNGNTNFPENDADGMIDGYSRDALELRRSEIRLRLDFQKALTSFIWVSAQAGYILNYRFDVDSGNFFRGFFGDQPYVMQNSVSGAPYFQVTLNLVSP